MKRAERKYVLETNLLIEALRDAVTNARANSIPCRLCTVRISALGGESPTSRLVQPSIHRRARKRRSHRLLAENAEG